MALVVALLDPERRRRARQARGERKEAILAAVAELVRTHPIMELSLEAIDRRAGLKPGLTSMYFGTLPGLLLSLLRREVAAWLESVEAACAEAGAPETLVRAVARDMVSRPLLARLLAVVPVVLETQAADLGDTDLFERWHLEALRRASERLATAFPELGADKGFALLRRAEMLLAALAREIDPRSSVLLARSDPELAALHPPAEEELAILLLASLRGA